MSSSDSAFLALISQSSGQYGQPMVMKLQDFYDPFAEVDTMGFNTPHPHQLHAVPGSPGGSNVVVKMEDLTTGLMEPFGSDNPTTATTAADDTATGNPYDMYNNHGAFVHHYAGYDDNEGEEGEEDELEEDEEEGIVSGVQEGEEDEEGEEERDTTKDSDYTPAAHGRASGRSSATTTANGGALRRKSARKVRKTIKYEDVGSEGGSDYGYGYGVSGESPIVLNLAQQPLISASDVPCNNKKALDQSWPRELLDMPIPDLNRYIKHNRLSDAHVKALKEARRRKKNRLYAQRSRTKKQTQGEQLESAEQAARELQAELRRMQDIVARRDKEIASLRSVLKAHNIKA